jgi:hypothetical protein
MAASAGGKLPDEIKEEVVQFGSNLLPLIRKVVHTDPQFSYIWSVALYRTGEEEKVIDVLQVLIEDGKDALISMGAACLLAQAYAARGDWESVQNNVGFANDKMIGLVQAASRDTALSITDTMTRVRDLALILAQAPPSPQTTQIAAIAADLQSSLCLSIDLAAGHLPSIHDASWKLWDQMPAGFQFLQFLDAGDWQIPIFGTVLPDGKVRFRRLVPLSSDTLDEVTRRIAGRVSRLSSREWVDPLPDVKGYSPLAETMHQELSAAGLNPRSTLLVAPSPAGLGFPLHHVFADQPIAYVPSISIGVALANLKSLSNPQLIGEVLSWRFGENPSLVKALKTGADVLAAVCAERNVAYEVLPGTDATEANVVELLTRAQWLKMSCHGLEDRVTGRFAFLLSDGNQDPPRLEDIINRPRLADRYLYKWEEIAAAASRCMVVFSTACATGSSSATIGGEQVGLGRSFLACGARAFLAPLWPVPGEAAQTFVNTLIKLCIDQPHQDLAIQLQRTRDLLVDRVPPWVAYAFVIHGFIGGEQR